MKINAFSILRAFTSLIFIYASTNHFFQSEKILGRLSKTAAYQFMQNETLFKASIMVSGMVMFIGGVAVLFGYKSRSAAIALLDYVNPNNADCTIRQFERPRSLL